VPLHQKILVLNDSGTNWLRLIQIYIRSSQGDQVNFANAVTAVVKPKYRIRATPSVGFRLNFSGSSLWGICCISARVLKMPG